MEQKRETTETDHTYMYESQPKDKKLIKVINSCPSWRWFQSFSKTTRPSWRGRNKRSKI